MIDELGLEGFEGGLDGSSEDSHAFRVRTIINLYGLEVLFSFIRVLPALLLILLVLLHIRCLIILALSFLLILNLVSLFLDNIILNHPH